MVEAGLEAERYEDAVAIALDQFAVAEQVFDRVGEAFGLECLGAGNGPVGADDRIAGARQDVRVRVDRA